MSKIKAPDKTKDIPLAVVQNMVTLATSGFGLVVALAWNEVIQKTIETYVDPLLGKNSGLISLLIYAVVMTLMAVFVTMQLARLQKKLENVKENRQLREQALST